MSKETEVKEPVKQEGDFKVKKKVPKKLIVPEETIKMDLAAIKKEEPIKVDLTQKNKEDAIQKQSSEESVLREEGSKVELQDVGQGDKGATENVIKEIPRSEEEIKKVKTEVKEAIRDQEVLGKKIPENIEKLVSFMQEVPGSTIEDYVRLNADYSNVDNTTLLREYYKNTRPHLEYDEVNFLLEDNFKYDEQVDEEREIRKKKLAYKEEVGKAKTFLNGLKDKYYDEIKLKSSSTPDQQKAVDFFNRYNEDEKVRLKQREEFERITKDTFNKEFEGFDFNLGEKSFRYGVKNPNEVVENQLDLTNFVTKFLADDGSLKDPKGYHKAMYAARNADTIAQHFYEQGKADAVKDVVAKSKNITTETRKEGGNNSGSVFVNGMKIKAISGADSSKLKIKTKKFN
jgi:hypothetical protein|tara:strand:- start:19 stop:1221 length:1203 start_codon:yes stop_codon:yes gene_type:complete